MRDLTEHGATLAFGSDWPVSSVDPLLGIATAVNRSAPGGTSWTPDQALSFEEAIAAYTNGVCKQLGRPTPMTVGSPADFVRLEPQAGDLFSLRVTGLFQAGAKHEGF